MKTEYWTKQKLYKEVDKLKYELGLDFTSDIYPINSKELGKENCKDLIIEELPFSIEYICGILYKGDNTTSIALNSSRESYQQNFDCMHELIHYFLHDISYCQLICSEKNIKQDSFIEWQANEGAAQFLVPYQIFIPKYLELEQKYAKSSSNYKTVEELANYFNVSYTVINNRINSLENELLQYKQGIDISSINIISKTKSISLGLDSFKLQQLYCRQCLSIIDDNCKYCPICGNDLLSHSFILKQKKKEGAGFMIYKSEIELDENSKVKICPICNNEEIDGNYCKICGKPIINKCTNIIKDKYGKKIEGCGKLAENNARYCKYCGSETTFFRDKLLCDYTEYIVKQENANSLWKENIYKLKSYGKVMLYANLLNTELLEINPNTVGINFLNGLSSFRENIIKKYIQEIEKVIFNIYNTKKDIKLYSNGEEYLNTFLFEENSKINIPINITDDDDLPS